MNIVTGSAAADKNLHDAPRAAELVNALRGQDGAEDENDFRAGDQNVVTLPGWISSPPTTKVD